MTECNSNKHFPRDEQAAWTRGRLGVQRQHLFPGIEPVSPTGHCGSTVLYVAPASLQDHCGQGEFLTSLPEVTVRGEDQCWPYAERGSLVFVLWPHFIHLQGHSFQGHYVVTSGPNCVRCLWALILAPARSSSPSVGQDRRKSNKPQEPQQLSLPSVPLVSVALLQATNCLPTTPAIPVAVSSVSQSP